tara:strand:- start:1902 stop:2264 length:363 start_codon:yes stop_codon:yes gene_type:complete
MSIKNVSKMLFSNQEKVELARKPASILKESQAIDGRLAKSSAKIDRAYLDYVKARQNFIQELNGYEQDVEKLIDDSAEVAKQLIDLGLRPNDIPEITKANQSNVKLIRIINDYKKAYPKI